jgi:hypothetical protein
MATGAGEWPVGDELAGEDGVPALSPPRNVTPPVALKFNGALFLFETDGSGLLQSIDPTDQAVALALLIRKGTLASVPEMGATFREIKRIDKYTPAKVNDAVNAALSSLLASKAITLRDVQVETNRRNGRVLVAVSYVNLKRTPTRPTTVQININ